jgi:type IV secretory pathway VirB6-like protein
LNQIYTQRSNIYNQYDFDTVLDSMNNRLCCTFSSFEEIEPTLYQIQSQYNILYKKIFIFKVLSTGEYALTYNIEQGNVNHLLGNTILVHRKKDSNTLYTINALNTLIKSLNNGVVDPKFMIEWNHYKNCILLTQENELKQLNTKVFKILEI